MPFLRTFPCQENFVYYFQIGHVNCENTTSPSPCTEEPLCGSCQMLLFAMLWQTQNPATSMQDKSGYAGCTANSVPRESRRDQNPSSATQSCQRLHRKQHFPAVCIPISTVADGIEHLFVWIFTILHLPYHHGHDMSIHSFQSLLKHIFFLLFITGLKRFITYSEYILC